MNKTPIQELIDYCVNNKRHHHCDSIHNPIEYLEYKDLIGKLSRCLEKEKQFGFDCFEAGFKNRHWFSAGDGDHAFNRFYSQYTQQKQ